MTGPEPSAEPVDRVLVRRLSKAASQQGKNLTYGLEPSLWLCNEINALADKAVAGGVETCGHQLYGRPAVYALWRPEVAWCAWCVPALTLIGDGDRCCDRCGLIGSEGELIHPCVVDAGAALIALGLCPACYRAEVLK